MPSSHYVGRFAPSPTGPLHFGSLVTALASYLDAKHQQGQWLVRIENVDTTRCSKHFSNQILATLEDFGLLWDGEVIYQGMRGDVYQQALQQLIEQDLAFPCDCSRKLLIGQIHHGRCSPPINKDFAWRFLCPDLWEGQPALSFNDRLQGTWSVHLKEKLDDFILRRRDGLWAYQLAVVCDDIAQGVNHVVRGIDLIDSTARQALLYQAFQKTPPQYAHLPISTEANGQKLSKQNLAKPLGAVNAANTLFLALSWLRQQPPAELRGSIQPLLDWAIAHWDITALEGLHSLVAPIEFQHS